MTGPFSRWLRPLTVPASMMYGAGVAWRARRYAGGRGAADVGVPVISVGNITAGGTGKTPMVRWIVEQLKQAGCSPAIALRGYGARSGDAGDEAAEYARLLPETLVVAAPDRTAALRRELPARPEIGVVILDDGFQHRQLGRALDLVLIDATRPGINGRLLPAGWLREPAAGLSRADAVIVTRAAAVDAELAAQIETFHGRPPIAWCRHAMTGVQLFRGGVPARTDLEWLSGRRLVASLGIGNPAPLRAEIERHGATIVRDVPARDHQRYPPVRLRAMASSARGTDGLLVTMKDLVKLPADFAPDVPIVVPDLQIQMIDGESALLALICAAATPTG